MERVKGKAKAKAKARRKGRAKTKARANRMAGFSSLASVLSRLTTTKAKRTMSWCNLGINQCECRACA
eukprot:2699308-Amphidinium_carterae.1